MLSKGFSLNRRGISLIPQLFLLKTFSRNLAYPLASPVFTGENENSAGGIEKKYGMSKNSLANLFSFKRNDEKFASEFSLIP